MPSKLFCGVTKPHQWKVISTKDFAEVKGVIRGRPVSQPAFTQIIENCANCGKGRVRNQK